MLDDPNFLESKEYVMKKYDNVFKKLAEGDTIFGDKYPNISIPYIECNKGWLGVIELLLQEADAWNKNCTNEDYKITIGQIKEKYGKLCFYYIGGDDMFRGMVRMAEKISATVCEDCGSSGKIHTEDSYLRCECRGCRLKRQWEQGHGWGKGKDE